MPIYEYQAKNKAKSCEYCSKGFEYLYKISDPPLKKCPKCGAPVIKLISAPAVGASKSGFDDHAKGAGFHKLQRLSKGEYEKKY